MSVQENWSAETRLPHSSLRIARTASGVVVSGRLSATDIHGALWELLNLLRDLEASAGLSDLPARTDAMTPQPDHDQPISAVNHAELPDIEEDDVLNWDNLIPVAPARPSGRIKVRLKNLGRDRPQPAEDPWAS